LPKNNYKIPDPLKVLLFVSTNFRGFYKFIDTWVLEFVVSSITGNNQWDNCISLHFYFHGLNQGKLEPHD